MGSKIRILNYSTVDSLGQRIEPEYQALLGRTLQHTGNGKFYVIYDFVWNGDKDEWMFVARERWQSRRRVCRSSPAAHLRQARQRRSALRSSRPPVGKTYQTGDWNMARTKTTMAIGTVSGVMRPAGPREDRVRFFTGQHWIEVTAAKGGGIEVRGLLPILIIPNVANNFIVKSRPDWSKP
jgi:hypothetical protein